MAQRNEIAMLVKISVEEAIKQLSLVANDLDELSKITENSDKISEKFENTLKRAGKELTRTGNDVKNMSNVIEVYNAKINTAKHSTNKTTDAVDEFNTTTKKIGDKSVDGVEHLISYLKEAEKQSKKTAKNIKDIGENIDNLENKKGKKKKSSKNKDTQNKSKLPIGDFVKADLITGAIKKSAQILYDFGVNSVNTVAEFQGGMNKVYTMLPGISKTAMDKLSKDIVEFSKKLGTDPIEATEAVYQALSAGVPQDNIISFIETAQKGAIAGVSDMTTAVDGLSSIVNAWGNDVINASQASDIMFTAVKNGKTSFGEISSSISQVGPLAASMGIQFGDVAAALSSMTAKGTPTAQAMTQMKAAFSELGNSTSNVSKIFKKVSGKSFKEFVANGGDLQEALKILDEASKKTGKGINELFGSIEAGQMALALTGNGAQKFAVDMEAMKNSAGATEEAYATMNKGIGVVFKKLKSNVTAKMIEIGNALAPGVEKMGNLLLGIFPYLDQLGLFFSSPEFVAFGNLMEQTANTVGTILSPALNHLATVIGGIILGLFQNMADNANNINQIYEGLGTTISILMNVFSTFATIMGSIFAVVQDMIYSFTGSFMQAMGLTESSGKELSKTLSSAFTLISETIAGVSQFISPILAFLAETFGTVLGGAIRLLVDAFKLLAEVINGLGGFFKKIFGKSDASDAKKNIEDVKNEIKELGKEAEKAGKTTFEIEKKEKIETTVNYQQVPAVNPEINLQKEIKIDVKEISSQLAPTLKEISTSIQNNPQDTTRNNSLLDLKNEIIAMKNEIINLKNILGHKLDTIAIAIKNRNVTLNVHGATSDEIVNKIKSALEKG